MRWKDKVKKVIEPRTTRIRTGFLFFPKRIEKETRWLEFAIWTEEYINIGKLGGKIKWKWVPLGWEIVSWGEKTLNR